MLNRGERRRRNKVIYNRRAKLFFRLGSNLIPCSIEETPINEKKYSMRKKHWRRAENYKELQDKSTTMHLFKNTGTIYNRCFLNKYEKRQLHKQSRFNSKLMLLQDNFE